MYELDFVEKEGGYARVFDGIEFITCQSLFDWCLIRDGISTTRTITWPKDVLIPRESSALVFLGKVYELWREVFGKQQPHDPMLRSGMAWCEFNSNIKRMMPSAPTVFVDREFFKLCIKRVRDQAALDKDVNVVAFSMLPGHFRISTKSQALCCPARGNWLDVSAVVTDELFERLPKRFMRDQIHIQQYTDRLIIDGHSISAVWCQEN